LTGDKASFPEQHMRHRVGEQEAAREVSGEEVPGCGGARLAGSRRTAARAADDRSLRQHRAAAAPSATFPLSRHVIPTKGLRWHGGADVRLAEQWRVVATQITSGLQVLDLSYKATTASMGDPRLARTGISGR